MSILSYFTFALKFTSSLEKKIITSTFENIAKYYDRLFPGVSNVFTRVFDFLKFQIYSFIVLLYISLASKFLIRMVSLFIKDETKKIAFHKPPTLGRRSCVPGDTARRTDYCQCLVARVSGGWAPYGVRRARGKRENINRARQAMPTIGRAKWNR